MIVTKISALIRVVLWKIYQNDIYVKRMAGQTQYTMAGLSCYNLLCVFKKIFCEQSNTRLWCSLKLIRWKIMCSEEDKIIKHFCFAMARGGRNHYLIYLLLSSIWNLTTRWCYTLRTWITRISTYQCVFIHYNKHIDRARFTKYVYYCYY